jgi:predicted MPP superfamily phosphohydrolase
VKILVIPDIHQKIALVNQILEKKEQGVDLTVFLGDYFDDFQDNQYEVNAMATWLKLNLYKEKRVFLMGNHDFHYRVLPYSLYCSGYASWKHEIIQHILSEADWNQIKYFHAVGNFWFSHAGITEKWFSHPVHGLTPETIEDTLLDVEKAVFTSRLWCYWTSLGCRSISRRSSSKRRSSLE